VSWGRPAQHKLHPGSPSSLPVHPPQTNAIMQQHRPEKEPDRPVDEANHIGAEKTSQASRSWSTVAGEPPKRLGPTAPPHRPPQHASATSTGEQPGLAQIWAW
jgi:hypothetical protein